MMMEMGYNVHLRKEKRRVLELESAVILPTNGRKGGVVDSSGRFVSESAYADSDLVLWGGYYDVDCDIEEIHEPVIFIGQMQGHWGNFLFDCMARMWFVLQDGHSYRLAYCGMNIEANALGKVGTGYCEFMGLLGIRPERLIEVRQPTRFSKVLVPEIAVFPGTFYTNEFRTVFDQAVCAVNDLRKNNTFAWKAFDKIYLTRRRMTACKETGEQQIERLFEKNGFQVIAPETMSVAEQIYIFSHCNVFASLEGTTSHNILFAQDAVKHIILRKQDYANTRQLLFDEVKGITPDYIDVFYEPFHGFPLSHDAGPFWIGVTCALRKWAVLNGYLLSANDRIRIGFADVCNSVLYCLKCVYYKYVLKK